MEPLGVLSDIHGNLPALEAVLSDARALGITRFVNLGDSLYGPLWPKETFDCFQAVDIVSIRGNKDRILLEASPGELACNPTLRFVCDSLSPTARR